LLVLFVKVGLRGIKSLGSDDDKLKGNGLFWVDRRGLKQVFTARIWNSEISTWRAAREVSGAKERLHSIWALLYHSQNYEILLSIAVIGPVCETGTSQTRRGNDVLWRFRVKEMEKGKGEGKNRPKI
jgi:hypothetical protein